VESATSPLSSLVIGEQQLHRERQLLLSTAAGLSIRLIAHRAGPQYHMNPANDGKGVMKIALFPSGG
jgi:hypothetical protein